MDDLKGRIIKGIGGFYYVYVPEYGLYECKAKGIFRKRTEKPLVGDDCLIDVTDEIGKIGNIKELLPRKSMLIRPEVANVDQALIIFSITKPEPNLNLLDRFLIHMEARNLPCIICLNKEDLSTGNRASEIADAYQNSGYTVCIISVKSGLGMEEVKKLLAGKTTTVAGPSGVGKSSFINSLLGTEKMETGEISEKIDRGRHTTRHSEIFYTKINGEVSYIFDTPGFSSLILPDLEGKPLAAFYHEFDEYEPECRFAGCAHIKEKECGIKAAVSNGLISKVRYENYLQLYEEVKNSNKY